MKRVAPLLAVALIGCAAAPKRASEPAPATEVAPPPEAGYPSPQAEPAEPGAPPPPMPTAPSASAATKPATPARQADAELDRAQRELDVAAGDCQNACRALSSMDRAAGRICSLSSGSDDDKQRCADAKNRVYSARDKVRNSCGRCAETSVDKNAPIPSTR